MSPRWRLPSTRRRLLPRVGLVAMRRITSSEEIGYGRVVPPGYQPPSGFDDGPAMGTGTDFLV